MEIRIPVGLLLRTLQYLVVGVALAAVTAIEVASTGGLDTWLIIAAAVIIGFLGPVDGLIRAYGDSYGITSWRFALKVEDTVKALLVSIVRVTTIPWTEIGITIFVVTRSRRHPIRGVQHRVFRMRLSSTPGPTAIQWTQKKGLLGRCWREEHDVDLDHHEFYREWMNTSRKDWRNTTKEIKQGLSFSDLKGVRGFGYVLASPIHIDGKYRGCLVIQVDPKYAMQLSEETQARKLIHHNASAVADLLRR